MDLRPNTLPKDERLYCRKDISGLLAGGRFAGNGPIRICWRSGNDAGHPRMMVSVPKKHFKRAVKRNLLKRRIREAYRLQKHALEGLGVDVLFIYNSKEVLDSAQIHTLVGTFLENIRTQLAK